MSAVNLQEQVEHELTWEPSVTSTGIGVTANDGIVTLTGFVPSYHDRVSAERAALRVHGVRSVANDIYVKLVNERTDPEVAADAATALEHNPTVPSTAKAAVRNGLVVLEGTVEWMFQKSAAEEAVRHVRGVVSVLNQLRIKPRVRATTVKSDIEAALRRSAETDAERIHVTVTDSAVTLTGRVRSYAEKLDAERAAWAAPGVMTVRNDIGIQL